MLHLQHAICTASLQSPQNAVSATQGPPKVLHLPQNLHFKVHKVDKVLRLPRNLHFKIHKVRHLPQNLQFSRSTKCCACHEIWKVRNSKKRRQFWRCFAKALRKPSPHAATIKPKVPGNSRISTAGQADGLDEGTHCRTLDSRQDRIPRKDHS